MLYAWGWMGGGGVQLQGYTDYCSQSIRGEGTDVEIHSFGKQGNVKDPPGQWVLTAFSFYCYNTLICVLGLIEG